MQLPPSPDLSSLARLAQNPAAELRPLLLRVHVQDFARNSVHDAASRASFEALALGLLPLVSDDVVADVAALLRSVPDVPRSVMESLASRLGPRSQDEPSPAPRCDPPSETAAPSPGDLAVPQGRELAALLDRATRQPALAVHLLARPDLSVFDRAALYRWASTVQRAEIRRDLGPALASAGRPVGAAAGKLVPTVLRAAEQGDLGAILAAVVTRLRVDPEPFDFDSPAGRELFAMALLALGLNDVECVRALILLGTGPFRTVPVVSDLAAVVRHTPWIVACYLAGSDGPARRLADPYKSPALRGAPRDRPAASGRLSPPRPGREEGPSVRAGHQP